jgi:hypothetical protein
MTSATIRELLLKVWGEQTCQIRPSDWPAVLQRLLKAAPMDGERERYPRGSLAPAVNEAAARIEVLLRTPQSDLAFEIWRAFTKFDRAHAARLADVLIAEQRLEAA